MKKVIDFFNDIFSWLILFFFIFFLYYESVDAIKKLQIKFGAFLETLRGFLVRSYCRSPHGVSIYLDMVSKMATKMKPVDNSVNERRLRPIYGKWLYGKFPYEIIPNLTHYQISFRYYSHPSIIIV